MVWVTTHCWDPEPHRAMIPGPRAEQGLVSALKHQTYCLHVSSGEGIIVSTECLAQQKKKKNPQKNHRERLECSSSPISCLL